jgi:hypothetical protein
MEEIFDEIPFTPAYDPVLPIDVKEEERGILCIQFLPSCSVETVRVERDIDNIMHNLGCVTRYSHLIKFYNLGNKMIIENNESKLCHEDVLIYNGQSFDLKGNVLICNKGFTSLTQAEALKILESATLHRSPIGTCKVVIKIEE